MINLEFDEYTYQEFLKKREYPSNSRNRPDNVSFMDFLIEEQRIMDPTPDGQRLLALIREL
ncbi:hypothetical protein AGMMS49942_28970 [Spirochaetia bacterium]|nr:hypothetical protein AGMMS49942_28970 [Spirochaetia bacterium]